MFKTLVVAVMFILLSNSANASEFKGLKRYSGIATVITDTSFVFIADMCEGRDTTFTATFAIAGDEGRIIRSIKHGNLYKLRIMANAELGQFMGILLAPARMHIDSTGDEMIVTTSPSEVFMVVDIAPPHERGFLGAPIMLENGTSFWVSHILYMDRERYNRLKAIYGNLTRKFDAYVAYAAKIKL